jgi:alanyl-tRNA synthetase
VALTGPRAEQQATETTAALDAVAKLLSVEADQVPAAVLVLLNEQRGLKKQLGGGTAAGEAEKLPKSTGKLTYSGVKLALAEAGRHLSVAPLAVLHRVESLLAEVEGLKKQLAQREAAGPLSADTLLESAKTIGDTVIVVAETPGAPQNLMRQLIDQLRAKKESIAVLLAAREGDDKVTLITGVSKDLEKRGVSAGKWIGPVAKVLGGGGGGRADMAQAGGKDPAKLPEALEVAHKTIAEMIGG